MSGPLRLFSLRGLALVVALAAGVLAVDAGSVFLTRISEPDDVRTAGYAAAAVAAKGPTTRETAVSALAAARQDATVNGITVSGQTFTIYPDGRVTLTGTKTARTFLMHRLSFLSGFAKVRTTVTVEPLPYSLHTPTAFSRSWSA
ncbi:hypothetical protein ACT8ZV_13535 [Nocardioides sp. MAHUQ-72]|uniref:hypothetical protein n=1 Tax=unclassified Nocardioides TaxID=2615069 RepID=UPI0036187ED9